MNRRGDGRIVLGACARLRPILKAMAIREGGNKQRLEDEEKKESTYTPYVWYPKKTSCKGTWMSNTPGEYL
jgi:hypothetical protein